MPRSSEDRDGIPYDSKFSRIVELIKGNTFSWEEITHLMDVLNSRVDNERENLKMSIGGGDAQLVSWTPEIPKTPSEGKHVDRTMIDASRENSDVVPVGVGASPIDIARAYMAKRSEGGEDLHNFMPNTARAQSNSDFPRKPPIFPLASRSPSICWPGAVVQDRNGFTTPQSQRARHRLNDFSGTPYSRTTLLKSTTKVKSGGETVDTYGSVGPVRRIRNRFASELRPRGSIFSSPSKGTSKMDKPRGFGDSPSTERRFEPGQTSGMSKFMSSDKVSVSSDRGISNPNVSSSQAVRKILEHLDRNKPTPKQMEDELKFATGWRPSPDSTGVSNVENELASLNNTDAANINFPFAFNKSSSKSNFLGNFKDKGKEEAKDAINGNATSISLITDSRNVAGANAKPHFGLEGTSASAIKFSDKNVITASNPKQTDARSLFFHPHVRTDQDSKTVAGSTSSDSPKNHGTKPSLPSILISKPVLQPDNRPDFTFPVSTSSGVNSEPPTPSITPSSSVSLISQPITGSTIPSYTFGTKKSTRGLVFSFPTPSSSSVSVADASDLKFSFGSEKKTRLSFNSFGKDAICY